MERQTSFDKYRVPDELWRMLESLLPIYEAKPIGRRHQADPRRIVEAIFYRFRTGCQWKAIPPERVPASTAHQFCGNGCKRSLPKLVTGLVA